jgi:uncharacterized protein
VPVNLSEEDRLESKLSDLKERIGRLSSAAVALSGGIDSVFLLHVCREVLGDRVIAVTSTSVTTPGPDLEDARAAARSLGVRHLLVETSELELPAYSENSPSRCFFCKDELYARIREMVRGEGIEHILDGANRDDEGDHRPGMEAAREHEVLSPLREARLGKEEVRVLARRYGIDIWDKPASACLSSRFPYGTKIVREDVVRVARAEEHLRELGFGGFRVRHHGDTARIEMPPSRIPDLLRDDVRDRIVARFKELGYLYVTVDLEGYRSGSMNEVLRGHAFPV